MATTPFGKKFNKHHFWIWIAIWVAVVLVLRFLGWSVGLACDGAVDSIL